MFTNGAFNSKRDKNAESRSIFNLCDLIFHLLIFVLTHSRVYYIPRENKNIYDQIRLCIRDQIAPNFRFDLI